MRSFVVGERAEARREISAAEVAEYVELSGDAARGRDVPAGLIGGMFSDLLGTRLPGRGTNWLKQKMDFCGVAEIGELLVASVEIVRVREEKSLINLRTECTGRDGRLVCTGEALVLVKELA